MHTTRRTLWLCGSLGCYLFDPETSVLEPHAGGMRGNGASVKAARATDAIVTACDINVNAAGLAYANEHRVENFLATSWTPRPDWVLGNPPFRVVLKAFARFSCHGRTRTAISCR